MLPQKFQDSENLRTLTLAQRMNTFKTTGRQKPLDIHETLKAWSRQEVKTATLTQRVPNPVFEKPKSPNLSYATAARNPEQSIIQNFNNRHEEVRKEILTGFISYLDQLIIASYDDLSTIRQDFQYAMSNLESQLSIIINDDQIKPVKLVQQMNIIKMQSQDYLQSITSKVNDQNNLLQQSSITATNEAVNALFTDSCTPEQIATFLQHPIDDLNEKQTFLFSYQDDFLMSSKERSEITINDFFAQAARVMKNRRKIAAEQLIRDFRDFVIQQNEWNKVLVAAINDCNCQNQQISANVHDAMSGVSGVKRDELYSLIKVFMNGRHESRQSLRNFYQIYQEMYNILFEAQNRTIDALSQISMPGGDYIQQVLSGWEQRWNKRSDILKQASQKQMKANAFYISGIVIVYSFIEKIKLESHQNDVILQNYFDNVLNSVESRFQRDLQRYNQQINNIKIQYTKIWDIVEVQKMSEIAQKLIFAMDNALRKRQKTLEKMTADQDNIFSSIIQDKMLEEIGLYVGIIAGEEFKCENLTNQQQVKWNNGELQIPLFDSIIQERNKDQNDESAIEENSLEQEQPRMSMSKKGDSSQAKRPEIKKLDPKKPIVYTLNEDGLYLDLPKFDNIDQNQYVKDFGFSFGQDSYTSEQVKDAIKVTIVDLNDKKKEVKKGKDDLLMNALNNTEIGSTVMNLQTQNGSLNIQVKITADLRILIHLAILIFMEEEGKRKAFNQSVLDFHDQIKEWQGEYCKILNDIQAKIHKDQLDLWNKEKAVIEKRNKSKKKDQEDEVIPDQPEQPQDISDIPDDVQVKLNTVFIPQQKDQDQDNIYLTLVYQLISYDDLKLIPTQEKYSVDIDDVMFEQSQGLDQTPNVSAPPSRPQTGKNSRKGSASQDKKSKQKQDEKPEQKVILPKPLNIKEFWTDARLVTHGQATILQMLINQVVSVELVQILEKNNKFILHYKREGQIIRQKTSQDTYSFGLQLQNHKMSYVQQAVQQIESKFAQRNGISQRLVEKVNQLVSNLSTEYINSDNRYDLLEPICENLFPREEPQQTQQVDSKDKKKEVKKTESNTKVQADSLLQKNNIAQFIQLTANEQSGQINGIYFQNILGQSIPLIRQTTKEFKEIFIAQIAKELKQSPQKIHRFILKQQSAYIFSINKKLEGQIIPNVMRQILMMQRELDKFLQEISKWGSDDKVPCDFTFADQTVAFLDDKYDEPQKLVELPQSSDTSHPTLNIIISLIGQLDMMKQDIESKFLSDVFNISRIIKSLASAVELGNSQQIQQFNKQVLVQRETSKLQALITGRITYIDEQLNSIKTSIKASEKLFSLQQKREETSKSQTMLQSLTLKNNSRTKSSVSQQKKYEFINDTEILKKATEFTQANLNLEFMYYLLSYDRSLSETVFTKQFNYTQAQEQYLQRQKSFNQYFSIFICLVTILDKLFVNKEKLDFQLVQDLCEQSKNFISSNKYEMKSRIYVNNDAVDICTQFYTEYMSLISKFPNVTISKENLPEQCQTEQDWINFYIISMTDRLERQFDDLRIKCLSIVAQRDNTMQIILNNFRQYSQKLIIQLFTQQRSLSVLTSQKYKEEFLDHFNKLYDKVRPVLSTMPDKKQQLLTQGQEFYEDMKTKIANYSNIQDSEFQLQIQFLLTTALVPQMLFSLYPSIPNSSSVSLQISTISDIFTKEDIPVKDTKAKTPITDSRQLILLQEISQILAGNDECFSYYLVKVTKCFTQNLNSKQVIFDINKIDQKLLQIAPNSAKPNLTQAFSKAPLQPIQDLESLQLYRSNVSRPASKLGNEKPGKSTTVQGKLPVLADFNLALQSLVIADSQKSFGFQVNVSIPVSNDKLSVEFGSNLANDCYSTIDGCNDDTVIVKEAFAQVSKVVEEVWKEFQEAINGI